MKVNRIQTDYRTNNSVQRPKAQVNFKASPGSVNDMITNSLKDKAVISFLKGLEWLKGESGGILITAVGTGAVAPWFIAHNPFVKAPKGASEEEKKEVQRTKSYTAWRQPISAVLAIIIQLGLLSPIDRLWDAMVNNKNFAKNFPRVNIDQSDLNTKSFIERNVKKELKAQGKTQPSIFSVFKDGWKTYSEKKDAYKKLVKDRVKSVQDSQINKVAKTFGETFEMRASGRAIEHSSVAGLLNTQIDDYIKDAKALQIDEKGLKFYSERAKVLMENEDYIKEIFKNAPDDEAQLKKFLENLKNNEKNAEVKKLIEEILEKPSDIQKSRINRTLARIGRIKEMCGGNYSEETYMNALKERNASLKAIIDNLESKKIKDVTNATKETIEKTVKNIIEACTFDEKNVKIKSVLQDTDTFNFNVKDLTQKVHKDATKLYKKLIENNYKSVNQISKVIIGVLITLPITCNLLNWVYPRFMELVFPRLAGVKKEGGDK